MSNILSSLPTWLNLALVVLGSLYVIASALAAAFPNAKILSALALDLAAVRDALAKLLGKVPPTALMLVGAVAFASIASGCSAAQKQAEDAAAARVFACLSSHASDFLTAGDPLAIVEKYAADCGETDLEAAIVFFESLNHPAAKPQAAKARAQLAAKRAAVK